MNWLFALTPRAGTIAGAAWFAWSWAKKKVGDNIAYGSQEIVREVHYFSRVTLLAACGRWAFYLIILLCFEFIASHLGGLDKGWAILAILLKYGIALTLTVINIYTLYKVHGMSAFLHPYNCLRNYLKIRTSETLELRLRESLLKKMAFYLTMHNIEEEADKLVSKAFPMVLTLLWTTLIGYLIMLLLFGKLYELLLETWLGLEFPDMLSYYLWPFQELFS